MFDHFLSLVKAKLSIDKPQKTMKGFAGVQSAVVGIGVAILVAAFIALVLSNVKDTLTANSTAANISQKGLDTVKSMADLIQPLGIVAIAVAIIAYLVLAFRGRSDMD